MKLIMVSRTSCFFCVPERFSQECSGCFFSSSAWSFQGSFVVLHPNDRRSHVKSQETGQSFMRCSSYSVSVKPSTFLRHRATTAPRQALQAAGGRRCIDATDVVRILASMLIALACGGCSNATYSAKRNIHALCAWIAPPCSNWARTKSAKNTKTSPCFCSSRFLH